MNVMAKPDTAADELAIFALSKMYGKHTVIYNKARPWTTLDPPYPMTETELHGNCQIHLVYVGKDLYGILRRKLFVEAVAPQSVESMLEPMKLHKTPKKQCQKEPWDLSVRHPNEPADTSTGGSSLVDNNNYSSKDQTLVHDEEQLTPIPEPGENVEVGCFGEMAVPVNQRMETDDLCYTVSEVKLYRLTNSELEKYLGKLPNKNNPTVRVKGDNNGIASNTNTEQSPEAHTSRQPVPRTAYSRLGRPLRTTASRQKYADPEDSDSDAVVPKVDNKTPRSKPSSSGPSASRIAAQNKKTVAPEFGLKASNVYKRSDSPTYSITSSGAS